MTKYVTVKVLIYAIIIIGIFGLISLAFYIMNQPNTIAFFCGIILLIISTVLPIEIFIKKVIKKK